MIQLRNIGRLSTILALALAASACAAAEDDGEPVDEAAQAATLRPEIDFANKPSYLPNNVIVLTFDDGPDYNNTAKVLDVLKQKGVKATFFINTENWSNVNTDPPMRDLVKRMVNEGHELGNHTVHHPHLGDLSASQIEAEVGGVETTVKSLFGASKRVTLFRAPFGEPYQSEAPTSAVFVKVANVVKKHAVQVGWAIDSFDYNCAPGDGTCVLNNVKKAVKTPGQGSYGIILMHSVHAQTAAALPGIIDYLKSKGFQLWTTEQVVKARFGKTSAQVVDGTTTPPPPPPPAPDAGVPPPPPPTGCSGVPAYVTGKAYNAGDVVKSVGKKYQCKPWPASGWCGAGGAYEPGIGWAWD